jgi:2-keto-4-pentenoate hydratase
MEKNVIVEGAAELIRQHREGEDIAPLRGDLAPQTLENAIAVQEAFITQSENAGRRIGGWKIALTTPVMQALVGIDHPCPGAVFSDTIHDTPARLDAGNYVRLAVESEIAVRIGTDAKPCSDAYTRDNIGAFVASCMAAIEIVDDRNWDYGSADARDLVADNSFNFGCVLGPAITSWEGLDLGALQGRMKINGALVGEGVGRDVLGHPFEALAWLANHLHGRNRMLRAGDVVLMGSVVATKWPGPGDQVVTEIDALGTAQLDVGS